MFASSRCENCGHGGVHHFVRSMTERSGWRRSELREVACTRFDFDKRTMCGCQHYVQEQRRAG